VRAVEPAGDGPSYGATFFEPVPEAAFVLGLDLGVHFVRGAVCDVRGEVRARQDIELAEPTAADALEAIEALATSLFGAAGVEDGALDGIVLGVPGAVDLRADRIHLATNIAGLEGDGFVPALVARLGHAVRVENDINLAALGEQWAGVARGIDDFAFVSIGTGLGAGIVLQGELHRGHTGSAGELDYARAGLNEDVDPCAAALSDYARSLGAPPDTRALFAEARAGDPLALRVVDEEARRIALHIAPISAVTDVGLVVLGGGIGTNGGDLLNDRIRDQLTNWLPTPPRVEASSLGDAAVLTGALAVGLRAARENVFVNRRTHA
jgi:predicted NBD/HSP70 family sugar kinase